VTKVWKWTRALGVHQVPLN